MNGIKHVIGMVVEDKHKAANCPVCGSIIKFDTDFGKNGFEWPHVAFGWYCKSCDCTGAASYKVKLDKFIHHDGVMDKYRKPVEAAKSIFVQNKK